MDSPLCDIYQFQDLPSDTLLKDGCFVSTTGDTADDYAEFGNHTEPAALGFTIPQRSGKIPLLNPTPLHQTMSKRIPFSFTLNRTLMPNLEKSPYPLSIDPKNVKYFCKSVPSNDFPANPEQESHVEPVLHHFLSTMSNFAFSGLPSSPEPTPKLVGKENSDYVSRSSSKNGNASEKEYEDINDGYFKCSMCDCFAKTRTELSHHMESHSSITEERAFEGENLAGRESAEKPFRCDQCGQTYKYGSAFARHREQDHRARPPAEKPFRCDACGMRFRYLKSFKKHRLNHTLDRLRSKNYSSKDAEVTDKEETPSTRHQFEKDEREGGSEQEWKGPNGKEEDGSKMEEDTPGNESESGQQKWLLSWSGRREQIPNKSEENATDEASITAASTPDTSQLWELLLRSSVSSHNATSSPVEGDHDEEEEESSTSRAKEGSSRSCLDCPFCQKGFRSRENLRLHVRKHTGERPFECSVCGRAFGGKSDMTRHLRIHTGERPYRCHVCTKRFARADYLSKHLTTHLH